MSGWVRPRNVAIAGGLVALFAFIPTPSANSTNPFETQGTKNIGNRWSSGGGTDGHTPGAATKRGNADDTMSTQSNPSGPRSKEYQESQIDQRPGEPGPFDKQWNKAHFGVEKGK